MLSNRDRATLFEIERGILIDDPEFVRSFQAAEDRISRDRGSQVYVMAIIVAAVLCVITLISGLPVTALALGGVAGLLVVLRRRRSRSPGDSTLE